MSVPVSVIIPAYNRAQMTARAVRSALAQRPEPPAEVIVVDDCSSDDTSAVAADAGARVLRHEVNRGEGGARNTGVAAATQDWVGFLDSDDEWLPNLLAELWPLRDGHVLLGGAALYLGPEEGSVRYQGLVRRRPLVLGSPRALAYPANLIPASGTLARRDVVLQAGGFPVGLRFGVDIDLWMRMLKLGTGVMSPVPVVNYYLHEGQLSQDRTAMARAQLEVIRRYNPGAWQATAWQGGAAWDELRRQLADGQRRAALGQAFFAARHPARAAGLLGILARRKLMRRRARDWLASQ